MIMELSASAVKSLMTGACFTMTTFASKRKYVNYVPNTIEATMHSFGLGSFQQETDN